MPRLVGHTPETSGQTFELIDGKVTIGRTPDNRIHIPDNSISSHHAELNLEGNDYLIRDLDSTNGTYINGEKVAQINLRRGDLVRLGNVELIYESETDPIEIPLPPLIRGIPLENSASKGWPSHFIKPGGGKGGKKEKIPWKILITLSGLLAGGALAFAIYTLLTPSA